MPISCDPATVVKNAACFQCVSRDMQVPVELYLLAVTANGLNPTIPTDPKLLEQAAAAFRAVPKEMREPLRLYLECQIASASGA